VIRPGSGPVTGVERGRTPTLAGRRRSATSGRFGASRRAGQGSVTVGRSTAANVEPVFANAATTSTLRVLGIDPGLTRCGYAVIDGRGPGSAHAMSMGVIRTPATDPLPQRLAALRVEIVALLVEFEPHVVAVERVFFQVNVRTAMSVAQVSGLALAEAAARGCEVVQYTPNQVKDAVAGWGGAGKEQVQKMVQARLGLSHRPQPADAADAAALALCHLASAPMRRSVAAAIAVAADLGGSPPK
jgi:crossover junction endodeoxyribonuclease RuvC